MAAELVTPSPLPPVNMENHQPNPSSQEVEVGHILPSEASLDLAPQFVNSVDQLRGISTALTTFLCRYDELQTHLQFIRTSIDSKSGDFPTNAPASIESALITKTQSPDTTENKTEAKQVTALPKSTVDEDDPSSSVSSCGKHLRRYILSNLSDATKIREKVVALLENSPKPGHLVLAGFGRFYITGTRAYTTGSPLIKSRQASVLLMECFMLMGYDPNEIDDGDKNEAMSAAVKWKKRLLSEGGLGCAFPLEAWGLLLLIGCYGIPSSFDNRDLSVLIKGSRVREKSDALAKSKILAARIPDVIKEMTKNEMEVEAVNMVYTFGLESRFSPKDILGSFLRHSKETWTQLKKGQGLVIANRANKKHLADLKYVSKCLQSHKVDPVKLLPEWQKMKQKMASLEREITETDKKLAEQGKPSKRKADDDPESSKHVQSQDMKRSRYGRQSPRAISPYNASTMMIPRGLEGGGFPGYLTSFPGSTPIQQHGSAASAVPLLSRGGGDIQPYDPYDAALRAAPRSELPMRQAVYEDSLRYSRLAGDASSSYRESRGYMDAVSRGGGGGGGDIYRSVPSVEGGFAGLPHPAASSTSAVSSRRPGADLYQFADAI